MYRQFVYRDINRQSIISIHWYISITYQDCVHSCDLFITLAYTMFEHGPRFEWELKVFHCQQIFCLYLCNHNQLVPFEDFIENISTRLAYSLAICKPQLSSYSWRTKEVLCRIFSREGRFVFIFFKQRFYVTRNSGCYTPFFLAPTEGFGSPLGSQWWPLATTTVTH